MPGLKPSSYGGKPGRKGLKPARGCSGGGCIAYFTYEELNSLACSFQLTDATAGNPIAWQWLYRDATVFGSNYVEFSTAQNPVFQPPIGGTYGVLLRAWLADGSSCEFVRILVCPCADNCPNYVTATLGDLNSCVEGSTCNSDIVRQWLIDNVHGSWELPRNSLCGSNPDYSQTFEGEIIDYSPCGGGPDPSRYVNFFIRATYIINTSTWSLIAEVLNASGGNIACYFGRFKVGANPCLGSGGSVTLTDGTSVADICQCNVGSEIGGTGVVSW